MINKDKRKHVLLGQLSSLGDCLYATAIARQIKEDYPGCHLTWAIGSMNRSVLNGNPFVDEVWEFKLEKREDMENAWRSFKAEACRRKEAGDFDEIFLTQINPDNFERFDGLIRSAIFSGYTRPITVPVAPVMRLSPLEVENVRCFAKLNQLNLARFVILFECSPKSQQSFVTAQFSLDTALQIVTEHPGVKVILSSNEPISSTHPAIIDASVLTFRENAELTRYCSLLIGCSSGITWLSTSDWAKPLPMVQLLKKGLSSFGSVTHDFEYYGISTDLVIEITDCLPGRVAECVSVILNHGFPMAKKQFHEDIPQIFNTYFGLMNGFIDKGEFRKSLVLFYRNLKRFVFSPLFYLATIGAIIYTLEQRLPGIKRKEK